MRILRENCLFQRQRGRPSAQDFSHKSSPLIAGDPEKQQNTGQELWLGSSGFAEVVMIDFIIDIFMDIADFFLELWLNKIGGRFKKKKRQDSDEAD